LVETWMKMAKEEPPLGEKKPVYPFLFRCPSFRMAGLLLLCPTPKEEGPFCRRVMSCFCALEVEVEVEVEVEGLLVSGFFLRGRGVVVDPHL